ncbi:MAG TPA: Calx-beta domain-containing protein, partial [Vicinamibacteria bacterium]
QFQNAVSSVNEDGVSVSLTVTRTAGTGLAIVDYDALSGTGTGGASSGSDFPATTGQLVFNPGENSKTITINITPDGLVEGGEYFTVVLSNPGNGATLGTVVTATVWIVDGD